MPRNPIAYPCREFAGLQRKTAVLPWRNPQGILIQTNLGTVIAGIEAAVHTGVGEEIPLRAEWRIGEQRETWIGESVKV